MPKILITIPDSLLKKADNMANNRCINRSKLFAIAFHDFYKVYFSKKRKLSKSEVENIRS